MVKLGVNIDHVATLRQARRTSYPDILAAALAAERGGADGITVHLREDRRHIQDRDVELLRRRVATKLNLEMASTDEMIEIARAVQPPDVCLVPERRQELTTEGGLDLAGQIDRMTAVVARLRERGIRVSVFIDPDERQVDAAQRVRADAIEIHTGAYADAEDASRPAELGRIRASAARGRGAGLIVNAGHGLTRENVAAIATLPGMHELNIGHSLVADALFVGIEEAVRRMKAAIVAAGAP